MRARHARRPDPVPRAPGLRRRTAGFAGTLSAVVATAVLTVVAGLAVWSFLPTLAGWRADVVMSGSMTPSIRTGDLVLSQPVDASVLVPGQVALFRSADGRTLVHRVQEVAGDGSLVTRGDANRSTDLGTVAAQDVLGLARLRVPFIGLPVVWFQERAWLPLALTAVVSVLAVAAASTEDERRRGRHLAEGLA